MQCRNNVVVQQPKKTEFVGATLVALTGKTMAEAMTTNRC
jgi:hypothetical protein